MKMTATDMDNHPKLKYYVSVNIPQVRSVPSIIKALKKFSGNTSEETIKEALLWNKGPTIEIVDGLDCGGVLASGCYTTGVDKIEVEKLDVDNFETGKDLKHTESGKLVYYIGVTLLHELCHWANDGTGEEDFTHEKFEQALYGRIIFRADKVTQLVALPHSCVTPKTLVLHP